MATFLACQTLTNPFVLQKWVLWLSWNWKCQINHKIKKTTRKWTFSHLLLPFIISLQMSLWFFSQIDKGSRATGLCSYFSCSFFLFSEVFSQKNNNFDIRSRTLACNKLNGDTRFVIASKPRFAERILWNISLLWKWLRL